MRDIGNKAVMSANIKRYMSEKGKKEQHKLNYNKIKKQPTSELSDRKKEFIKRVEAMSDDQLDRLEQILALVETTGQ